MFGFNTNYDEACIARSVVFFSFLNWLKHFFGYDIFNLEIFSYCALLDMREII
jgi:hypothetical protein